MLIIVEILIQMLYFNCNTLIDLDKAFDLQKGCSFSIKLFLGYYYEKNGILNILINQS